MSISGAWISGKFDVAPLARALVVFDLGSGGQHEPLPIACYVARVRAEGMGVEWRELAPQIVSDLLLFATGSQPGLERQTPTVEEAVRESFVPIKTYAG